MSHRRRSQRNQDTLRLLRGAVLLSALVCALPLASTADTPTLKIDSATADSISDRIDAIVASTTPKSGGGPSLTAFEGKSQELKRQLLAIANALDSGDRPAARAHAGRAKALLLEMSILARDLNVSLTPQEQSLVDRFIQSS